ncbi:MAG TPA: acyltransferase family protein [Acidimicrobiales bacterium]|nr:acyltransferase family protein [Acidimicrobiales bacterium]
MAAEHRATPSRRRSPGHRPAIDGLRAVAVAAVLLYHGGVSWLPGGFLGVDVFFAVSGYLICSLLVEEWSQRGAIDLWAFWRRRARRLLPALYALLFAVMVVAPVVARDTVTQLRGDVPAAFAYMSNWWQVLHHQSYFTTMGRPPLLQHLWSLAVEEQFYLVFPVVLAFVLRFTRGRRDLVAVGALVLGLLSTAAMALGWRSDVDPSHLYYRTDTRAVALCMGVALGALAPLFRQRATVTRRARQVIDVAGAAGLVVLALLMHGLTDFSSRLYRGGFAVAAAASVLVIVAAARRETRLARVLGARPLEWLGSRSYAVYLWHWPVFVLTRPHLDIALSGWRLLALRTSLTLVLAELSWRLVEQPWRTGSAQRAWRSLTVDSRRRVAATAFAAIVVVAVSLAAVDAPPDILVASGAQPAGALAPVPTTVPAPAPAPAPAPVDPPPTNVLGVGDSVMLAARPALETAFPGRISVDAAVGRQVDAGLDILQRYKDSGALDHLAAVVVDLGTNGPMSDAQFDRLVQILSGARRVVVLNVRVPRRWEAQSNDAITRGVTRYPNIVLADWHSIAGTRGVLGRDGVHPTPSGAGAYSQLVAETVAAPA